MPESPVLQAVSRFRGELEANDAASIGRLVGTYTRLFSRLQGNIDALTMQIGEDLPTAGQVIRTQRYRALMRQTADELERFQALTAAEAEALADLGITAGSAQARQLVAITVGDGSVAARLNSLPKEAIESLLGFLAPDGPLYERISQLAPHTAEQVTNAITSGVALGHNPRKIARAVETAYGQGLTSALRTVRTVQLWSYREANRATYIANSGVLEGWIWHASLDGRVCMSCVAQHGTLHSFDETLNDHYNGRCAMVPKVKGFDNPVDGTGREWFRQQDEATQRGMMGNGKYEAWQSGDIRLRQLSSEQDDDVYGQMRTEASLKSLVAG